MALFNLENFIAAKEAFSDALKLDSKQNTLLSSILRKRELLWCLSFFLPHCLLVLTPRQVAKD